MKPFIKWAGGKTQLLPQIIKNVPPNIKTYVEPFVGGGAVFFKLNEIYNFNNVILNDYNSDLINTYKSIRDSHEDLIGYLVKLEELFARRDRASQEYIYYNIRDRFNKEENNLEHSAHFIFLNKLCFNGLYRVNLKGEFNVPFGKYKNPTICNKETIKDAHRALQGVKLINGDFEKVTNYITANTFVYMDPPYRPLSNTSSFNSYQRMPFNDENQKRLARWFTRLDSEIGAKLMLSNSDPKNTDQSDNFFDDLYQDYRIRRVSAKRSINSKGNSRGNITELLITNY